MGGTIVGIDVAADLIQVAKEHASLDSSLSNLSYHVESVEQHCLTNSKKYDLIVAFGVIEHVDDPEQFLKDCVKCLKPGGSIFISTFSKTTTAWLVGIIVYEYILGIIPVGTHDWNKFISAEEVQRIFTKCKCTAMDVLGVFCNWFTKNLFWSESTSVFYVLHAIKD